MYIYIYTFMHAFLGKRNNYFTLFYICQVRVTKTNLSFHVAHHGKRSFQERNHALDIPLGMSIWFNLNGLHSVNLRTWFLEQPSKSMVKQTFEKTCLCHAFASQQISHLAQGDLPWVSQHCHQARFVIEWPSITNFRARGRRVGGRLSVLTSLWNLRIQKEDADWTLLKGGILNGLTSSMGCRNAWDPNMGVHCTDLFGKSWENIGTAVGWKVAVRIQRRCFDSNIHRGCPSTQKPQSQKIYNNKYIYIWKNMLRACSTAAALPETRQSNKSLALKDCSKCSRLAAEFRPTDFPENSFSIIKSSNWSTGPTFLFLEVLRMQPRSPPQYFIQDPRCYEIFYCTPHESIHDVWLITCSQNDPPAGQCTHERDPQNTCACMFLDCFGTCPKKKIGSSRRSVTIGVQGTLFQSSASRQTPPAKLLRVSAWECEEILCQKRASKLLEHHWKSHMSGTLLQPEPQDGTKMLRTDSRTDIPQATRTGLVRSPSCSPISWRWKPLAMIASMASHKSFTTWHSALIQLKTIAKHLALPKLNNVDWKGDEFTCKLTYAYHKLSQTNITENSYCNIVALPSYTSLNLLELD